jgi:hypothetical protein
MCNKKIRGGARTESKDGDGTMDCELCELVMKNK